MAHLSDFWEARCTFNISQRSIAVSRNGRFWVHSTRAGCESLGEFDNLLGDLLTNEKNYFGDTSGWAQTYVTTTYSRSAHQLRSKTETLS